MPSGRSDTHRCQATSTDLQPAVWHAPTNKTTPHHTQAGATATDHNQAEPLLPHLPPIGCSCAVPRATSCSQHRIQGPAAQPSNRLLQGPAAHPAAPAQQQLLQQPLQQAREQQLRQGGATAADYCCPASASRLLLLLVLAAAAAAAAAQHWRHRCLDTQQARKGATAATAVSA